MDFTDKTLIARLQAFSASVVALNGEYEAVAKNWPAFVKAAEALAEMSPQAALIHDWYHNADEGAAFPDGQATHDDAWYEMWYAYFDYREAVLTRHHPSWLAEAHALDKLSDSFSDVRSWFPSWDGDYGVWKS